MKEDDIVKEEQGGDKRMFFTTSDLLERMNGAMAGASGLSEEGGPRFELQKQMPDGSYRRAHRSEIAAADSQAKLKQAADFVRHFSSQEKLDWARAQRKAANALFAAARYAEATDLYLTCLVALEPSPAPSNSTAPLFTEQAQQEIQLPVLLNLALCSLKMGMPSKADQFCSHALALPLGKLSPKAHFRRGKTRMLMGQFHNAKLDFDESLRLLHLQQTTDNDLSAERDAILRDQRKLHRLVAQAEKNKNRQKKAMQLFLGGTHATRDAGDSSHSHITGSTNNTHFSSYESNQQILQQQTLYPEHQGRRKFSTLRELPEQERRGDSPRDAITQHHLETHQPTIFQWYMGMVARFLEKLIDIIGEEEYCEMEYHEQEYHEEEDFMNVERTDILDDKKNS